MYTLLQCFQNSDFTLFFVLNPQSIRALFVLLLSLVITIK